MANFICDEDLPFKDQFFALLLVEFEKTRKQAYHPIHYCCREGYDQVIYVFPKILVFFNEDTKLADIMLMIEYYVDYLAEDLTINNQMLQIHEVDSWIIEDEPTEDQPENAHPNNGKYYTTRPSRPFTPYLIDSELDHPYLKQIWNCVEKEYKNLLLPIKKFKKLQDLSFWALSLMSYEPEVRVGVGLICWQCLNAVHLRKQARDSRFKC